MPFKAVKIAPSKHQETNTNYTYDSSDPKRWSGFIKDDNEGTYQRRKSNRRKKHSSLRTPRE